MNIYKEAARRIESDVPHLAYCCNKLNKLDCTGITAQTFADVFAPTEEEAKAASATSDDFVEGWRGYKVGAWGKWWGADAHNCRILALCFAAAMAEAGDL